MTRNRGAIMPGTTRRFWHWSERALFAVGVLLLGYVALIAVQAKLYEIRARQYLDPVVSG